MGDGNVRIVDEWQENLDRQGDRAAMQDRHREEEEVKMEDQDTKDLCRMSDVVQRRNSRRGSVASSLRSPCSPPS